MLVVAILRIAHVPNVGFFNYVMEGVCTMAS